MAKDKSSKAHYKMRKADKVQKASKQPKVPKAQKASKPPKVSVVTAPPLVTTPQVATAPKVAPEPKVTTAPKVATAPNLPNTREALLDLHRDTRKRRNRAKHGSPEHVAAIDLLGQIEVEIARIERAMDPPLG
ncbi:MAG: hypothetical protein K0S97_1421 [Chloroflexota bacterium]|jgi:hypothetical protein|nr:hypothetical protein [Chloroflexota bacterium]